MEALALPACAAPTPVDTAIASPAPGLTDPPDATESAAWAFALPPRTHGYLGAAARAVSALDYSEAPLPTARRRVDQLGGWA